MEDKITCEIQFTYLWKHFGCFSLEIWVENSGMI